MSKGSRNRSMTPEFRKNYDNVQGFGPNPLYKVKSYNGVKGQYMCKCMTCGATFYGDKRDIVCPDCEVDIDSIKIDRFNKSQLSGLRKAIREHDPEGLNWTEGDCTKG